MYMILIYLSTNLRKEISSLTQIHWEEENGQRRIINERYRQIDDILNELHIDILVCLYRWEIINSAKSQRYNIETIKTLTIKELKVPNEILTGLSTTYANKFIKKNAKSIAQTLDNFKGL